MKKLVLLLTMILFISCSTEQENPTCNCGEILSEYFHGYDVNRSTITIRNKCDNKIYTLDVEGWHTVGNEYCGY